MKNRNIFCIAILGTAVCVIFSFYFYNAADFTLYQIPIYFMVLGLAGSVSLALLLANRFRDTIYVNVLIYILFVIVVYQVYQKPTIAVILFIYMFAVLAAIFCYARKFEPQLKSAWLSRPLVLAGLTGLFFILATLIHGLLFTHNVNRGIVLTNMPVGFFLGLGIGIGRELKEKYWT